ncbi:uncharacterized protein LOC119300100 [Triticum dicoccoides]|uniref:uncharacterized protein LOC119300100 n=1 Tax=Triticum dicoccoides TaxID=85692 RepID=UPI00188E41C7|nr:uncharacterized protein LOC119300100 [Triticum dicoccoides]
MGFEGLLKFPLLNKLNLKFSVWLLSKIDEIRRMIIIDESRQYKMSPKDVKNVFGIPCSGRRVLEKISDGKQGIVYLIRKRLGMEKKDGHSLKAAQKILEKQYRNPMSQEEIKVFKTAFIIFIVGHLLAPTSKHDYGTFAYWHALENTDDLQCWNWGEFVLDALCQAATRIKNELSNGSNISYITGCTLFLQVFYLDNADLGPMNMDHGIPRISIFNNDILKNMIQSDTKVMGERSEATFGKSLVSYHSLELAI